MTSIRRRMNLLNWLELIGGMTIASLSFFLFMYIYVQDSKGPKPVSAATSIIAFLIVMVPSIVVAGGTYLQALRRKSWAAIAVVVGGFASFFFIALNAGLNYALIQDRWGQRLILIETVVIILTVVAALINALTLQSHRRAADNSERKSGEEIDRRAEGRMV